MINVGIIIQARMGSSRLPGKVLLNIGNKPLLAHIVEKLQKLKNLPFIIATSLNKKDDHIVEFCRAHGLSFYRGSESDVLERYYLCAKEHGFKNIVRLTADNPFVDVDELENMLDFFLETKIEYLDNFSSLPIGVGCEILSFRALEASFHNGLLTHHREHVNEYIIENPTLFQSACYISSARKKYPTIRLTVDTVEDWQRANYICAQNRSDPITTENAIKFAKVFLLEKM